MKLFKIEDWNLQVSEEAWGLLPFKKLLDRDKSKNKTRANAEMLFIWFFCDIKSNYLLMKEEDRIEELINDVNGLPKGWKVDKEIREAITFYLKFETVIERLYKQSLRAAFEVGNYLDDTKALLRERDNSGRIITKMADITRGLKDVKIIIKELKATEQEVLKEQKDNLDKSKGAKKFNIFEDGLPGK